MWDAYRAFGKAAPKDSHVSLTEIEFFIVFLCKNLTGDLEVAAEVFDRIAKQTEKWREQ
jgi:hypothetical protein